MGYVFVKFLSLTIFVTLVESAINIMISTTSSTNLSHQSIEAYPLHFPNPKLNVTTAQKAAIWKKGEKVKEIWRKREQAASEVRLLEDLVKAGVTLPQVITTVHKVNKSNKAEKVSEVKREEMLKVIMESKLQNAKYN